MKRLIKLLVAAALGLASAAWLYGSPWGEPGFASKGDAPTLRSKVDATADKDDPTLAVNAQLSPPEPTTGAGQSNAGYTLSSDSYRGIVAPNGGSVFSPLGAPLANPSR
jgi:hypothetical protein